MDSLAVHFGSAWLSLILLEPAPHCQISDLPQAASRFGCPCLALSRSVNLETMYWKTAVGALLQPLSSSHAGFYAIVPIRRVRSRARPLEAPWCRTLTSRECARLGKKNSHSRSDSTPGGIETHVARGCRCHTQKARTEGLNSNVPAGVFSINAMVMLRLGAICPVAQCGVR